GQGSADRLDALYCGYYRFSSPAFGRPSRAGNRSKGYADIDSGADMAFCPAILSETIDLAGRSQPFLRFVICNQAWVLEFYSAHCDRVGVPTVSLVETVVLGRFRRCLDGRAAA